MTKENQGTGKKTILCEKYLLLETEILWMLSINIGIAAIITCTLRNKFSQVLTVSMLNAIVQFFSLIVKGTADRNKRCGSFPECECFRLSYWLLKTEYLKVFYIPPGTIVRLQVRINMNISKKAFIMVNVYIQWTVRGVIN